MENGKPLPDIMAERDWRELYIPRVGVEGVVMPIQVLGPLPELALRHTVATIDAYVNLNADNRGVNMSRFIQVLQEAANLVSVELMPAILGRLIQAHGAEDAFVRLGFPYFYEQLSPQSQLQQTLTCPTELEAWTVRGSYEVYVKVTVPYTSCCPCSKEISSAGAHNQRSQAEVKVLCKKDVFVPFEDIVSAVFSCASSPIYDYLKREDEKHVTEQAYANPKFVEDMARDLALVFNAKLEESIDGYHIKVVHYEAIHTHNAVAFIRGGALIA